MAAKKPAKKAKKSSGAKRKPNAAFMRLPSDLAGRRFRNVVTGVRVQPLEGGLSLGPLFTDFPVAVLEAVE